MATTTGNQRRQKRIPTTPERPPVRKLRLARLGRQAMVALLVLFVVAGLLGLFGSKTKESSAANAGYRLTVVYPGVTRPGLPIRWNYRVEHPGGFSGPITLATTDTYVNLLDVSSLEPQPSSETAGGGFLVWSFDPPKGDEFVVSIDAATEVGLHELPAATAQLLIDDRPVVQVKFKTVVMP